jgi:hypothetical protein
VAVRWYGQHLRELGPGDALAIDAAGVTVGADAIPAQAGCTITNWFSSDRVVSFFTRQSEVAGPRSRSTCARANLHAEAHRAASRLRARQVLPRNWTVFARKRACRAVITDECETHGFARTLFHAARAVEIIQGRLCEAGIAGVDLDVRV